MDAVGNAHEVGQTRLVKRPLTLDAPEGTRTASQDIGGMFRAVSTAVA